MKMKQFYVYLLASLLAISLSACAGDGNVEQDSDGVIEEETQRETARVTDRETARETAADSALPEMPLESAVRGMF